MHGWVIALSIAGWAASVAGALLQNWSIDVMRKDGEGMYTIPEPRDGRRRTGVALAIAGATVGLVGTILSLAI